MKRLLVFFVIIFLCTPCIETIAQTDSGNNIPEMTTGVLSKFWINYFVVNNVLKGDTGRSSKVFEIDETNPQAIINISKFWWAKIMRECPVKEIISEAVKYVSDNDKRKERIDKEVDLCARDIVLQNWEIINETIDLKYKQEKPIKSYFVSFFE